MRTAGWLRLLAICASCSIVSACTDASSPDALAPEEVTGVWQFRGAGSEWCTQYGPTVMIEVTEASPEGSYLNIIGQWDRSFKEDPPPVPNAGEFSGSINRLTGEYEILLWRFWSSGGWVSGELRGRVSGNGSADGRLTWGFCSDQRGVRVTGP